VIARIASCFPFGLQSLAPPLLRAKQSVAASEEDVPFRYLDGGYAENTALPLTLAKMQRDCGAGAMRCPTGTGRRSEPRAPHTPALSTDQDSACLGEPLDVVLVNDGNSNGDSDGFGPFKSPDPLRALFSAGEPPADWVRGMFGLPSVPNPAVFAEAFPAASAWRPYCSVPTTRIDVWPHEQRNITSHVAEAGYARPGSWPCALVRDAPAV